MHLRKFLLQYLFIYWVIEQFYSLDIYTGIEQMAIDIKEFLNGRFIFVQASCFISESYSAHSSVDPRPLSRPIRGQCCGHVTNIDQSEASWSHSLGKTCLNDLSSHLEFISPPCDHFATRAMRVNLLKIPLNVLINCKQ